MKKTLPLARLVLAICATVTFTLSPINTVQSATTTGRAAKNAAGRIYNSDPTQEDSKTNPYFPESDALKKLVISAVDQAVDKFGVGGLTRDKIAITLVDITDRNDPKSASYRGQEPTYPASVVKLFYLAAVEHALESGKIKRTPEIQRGIHDMIVSSSNDATQFVLDVLTDTTGGPELSPNELRQWQDKRNSVNRFFAGLGYYGININQKTWCEGPYGRERQGLGPNYENRNKLTTEAVARLWYEIIGGKRANPEGTREMLNLLHRDPRQKSDDADDQASAFSGKSLPGGSQYYSKAGWTSTTRHDSAFITIPNGRQYILAVFTVDNSKQTDIIPFVSKIISDEFEKAPAMANLVITNGKIWTGNPAQPWAEAIASRGERIIAVGSKGAIEKLVDSNTRVIDLKGKLALPGFIDDHTHFFSGGFGLLSVNLRDARSQEEFATRIKAQAEKLGPGRWIRGGEWDHELWPSAPLPTKELIDKYTAKNPVFVERLDGHMALANSAVLKLANITKDTQDPPGGTIVRDPKTGEPTGVLKDAAMSLVTKVIPEPSPAEYDDALTAALKEAARVGLTSIQDITLWPHYDVYKRFLDSGRLTLHVYARTPMSSWKRQVEMIERYGAGNEWLRFGGFKAFMDGSLGSTTALFFQPYSDAPSSSGLSADDNIPEGKLQKDVIDADAEGLQCSVHAIGDRANNLLLNYFESAEQKNGQRDRRFRIEHAQHLLASDIPRFGKLGVIASVQPYHTIDDGRWAEKRIGPERIKTTYAFRSLMDSGAKVVFGSDWPVAPLSPLLGIYAAVTRETIDGKNPKGWVPEQKVTVEEAVRAYTSSGAYAEFSERDKGTLEPGKLADIVILDKNIFEIDPDQIAKTSVVYTIAGGRIVYSHQP